MRFRNVRDESPCRQFRLQCTEREAEVRSLKKPSARHRKSQWPRTRKPVQYGKCNHRKPAEDRRPPEQHITENDRREQPDRCLAEHAGTDQPSTEQILNKTTAMPNSDAAYSARCDENPCWSVYTCAAARPNSPTSKTVRFSGASRGDATVWRRKAPQR